MDELKRSLNEARPHCVPRALCVINPGNPTGTGLKLKLWSTPEFSCVNSIAYCYLQLRKYECVIFQTKFSLKAVAIRFEW